MRNMLSLVVALLLAGSPALLAQDLMWQPVSATTNMGITAPYSPNFLISQVGLSSSYVSGVTPAFGYTATHNNGQDEWISAPGNLTGFVTFDLGTVVAVSGMRLWNSSWASGGSDVGIRDFQLLSDSDNDPLNGTTSILGSFTAADDINPHAMQFFTFPPGITQFVHLSILNNHGSPDGSGFAEAAFVGTTAVPEPLSVALIIAAGAAGLFWHYQRKKRVAIDMGKDVLNPEESSATVSL